jgi:adenosylhomocysteine nucleosidase
MIAGQGNDPEKTEKRFWFKADPASLEIAKRVAAEVHLKRSTPQGESLEEQPRIVVGGKGVSGPTFVDNAAYREWVWRTFNADALDMETAAVGTVAYVNRVPFIAFRSLSDLAGGGKGKNEARVFFKLAADNSAAVVLAYLQGLDEKKIGTILDPGPAEPNLHE